MNKTSKIVVVAIAIFAATMLVSAAVISHFGKVNTELTVEQSIVISQDGENWENWNYTFERAFDDMVNCTYYTDKLWIKNQACVDAEVEFEDVCIESPNEGEPDGEGIDITHYVFGDSQTIGLRYKNPVTWEVINEELQGADLTFNTCGPTFDYTIDYWGLDGDYKLVYYIDQDPRFEVWGQVFVIDAVTFIAYNGGVVSGSQDIPTLPYEWDWNAGDTGAYPGNEHTSGAKFWLIPANSVSAEPGEMGIMTSWQPTTYLFETDLGLYLDCDDTEPIYLANVFPLFATEILKAGQTYCWISCYHVDFDIKPGSYTFQTTVYASPMEPTI